MAEAGIINHKERLNRMNPAAGKAKLGDVVYDLLAAYNDLAAKYNLLLAHMDAGNVAGLGTAHAATYAPANATVKLPESR